MSLKKLAQSIMDACDEHDSSAMIFASNDEGLGFFYGPDQKEAATALVNILFFNDDAFTIIEEALKVAKKARKLRSKEEMKEASKEVDKLLSELGINNPRK